MSAYRFFLVQPASDGEQYWMQLESYHEYLKGLPGPPVKTSVVQWVLNLGQKRRMNTEKRVPFSGKYCPEKIYRWWWKWRWCWRWQQWWWRFGRICVHVTIWRLSMRVEVVDKVFILWLSRSGPYEAIFLRWIRVGDHSLSVECEHAHHASIPFFLKDDSKKNKGIV